MCRQLRSVKKVVVGRLRWVGIALVIVWSIGPVYWALNTSVMTNYQATSISAPLLDVHPDGVPYRVMLGLGATPVYAPGASGGIEQSFLNSSIESIGAMLLSVVLAVFGAYAFAQLRFRLKPMLFYLILVTLALPTYATLLPLYRLMADSGLINTYLGIVLVFTAGQLPLAMWIIYNTFLSIPQSVAEAAVVDGASPTRALLSVALPIAAPGVAATAIICFLFSWGQFLFPLVLSNSASTEPVTLWLASVQTHGTAPFNIINAGAILSIALPVALVVVAHRWIMEGIATGSVR